MFIGIRDLKEVQLLYQWAAVLLIVEINGFLLMNSS